MRLPRVLIALLAAGFLALAPRLAAEVPGDRVFAGTVYNVFHEEFATDADFFAQVESDLPARGVLPVSPLALSRIRAVHL